MSLSWTTSISADFYKNKKKVLTAIDMSEFNLKLCFVNIVVADFFRSFPLVLNHFLDIIGTFYDVFALTLSKTL